MRKKTKKKTDKLLYWTPRLLSIVFILFLMLFSLDVFGEGHGFWGTILGLFMHNVPALILLIVLIISWKHEIAGGIVFISAGVAYIGLLLNSVIKHSPHDWYKLLWSSLLIAGSAFLIGILFLIGWCKKKKNLKANS